MEREHAIFSLSQNLLRPAKSAKRGEKKGLITGWCHEVKASGSAVEPLVICLAERQEKNRGAHFALALIATLQILRQAR